MKFSSENDFPKSQAVPLHVDKQDLSGKTLVITGGNAGIGLQCAKEFAAMEPSKIILACRNMKTAEKAIESIKNEIGFKNVEAWQLDQSSFASVKAFAKKYNESGLDLHLLLANAGILPFARENMVFTDDGHEEVLEVNHISASLLTLSLLPAIRRTAAKSSAGSLPRIIIVSSDVHYWAQFNVANQSDNVINALDKPEYFAGPRERYQDTKLLNLFFAQELANKLSQSKAEEDHKIVVSSCNPGLVLSSFSAETTSIPEHILKHARNLEEGCKTHLFASIDPSAGTPGEAKFYHNCRATEAADITLGEEGDVLRKRVWKDTLEVLQITEADLNL